MFPKLFHLLFSMEMDECVDMTVLRRFYESKIYRTSVEYMLDGDY